MFETAIRIARGYLQPDLLPQHPLAAREAYEAVVNLGMVFR